MIPAHLIDKAAAAIYQATVFGDEFALDAWRDMPEDSHIKTGTREFATAALEAVAANIWDQGHQTRVQRGPDECTCNAWNEDECACGNYGTGPITTPNPYKANP